NWPSRTRQVPPGCQRGEGVGGELVGKADTPANRLQFCVLGGPYIRGNWKSLLETPPSALSIAAALRMSWACGLFLGWNSHLPTGQKQANRSLRVTRPRLRAESSVRAGWNRVASDSLSSASNQSHFPSPPPPVRRYAQVPVRCVALYLHPPSAQSHPSQPLGLGPRGPLSSMLLRGSKRNSADNSRAGIGRGRRLADGPPPWPPSTWDLNRGLARAKERLVPEPFLSLNLIWASWGPMSDFHPLTGRTPLSLLGLGHLCHVSSSPGLFSDFGRIFLGVARLTNSSLEVSSLPSVMF
ncbi:hypothetical protein CORC01_00701, partial [Colletotrichum orchidophilum]